MTVSLIRPDTNAFLLLDWNFNWNLVTLFFIFLCAVLLGNLVAFWYGIGVAMLLWNIVALGNGLLVTLLFGNLVVFWYILVGAFFFWDLCTFLAIMIVWLAFFFIGGVAFLFSYEL